MRTNLLRVLPLVLVAAACSDQTFTVDVPFRVTSVTPSPAASGVSRQASLVVTFSEEIDAASVANAESFKVEVIAGNLATPVAGTYQYGPVGDAPFAVSFKPSRPFAWLTTVRITLTSAIKRQRDGAPLPTPMTFEFRTEAPPPLGVTRITPHDGMTHFERTGEVKVTFTEPVDCKAFDPDGPVTFTETRDTHPHWALPSGSTRPVPGTWDCPEMSADDPLATEGTCRSSNSADAVDYCTVTFSWAARDPGNAAIANTLALAPSSRFELNLPGRDAGSQLSEMVRSRRAVQRTSDLGVEVHGALTASVNVEGAVATPPALAVTSARLEQPTSGATPPGRDAVLRVGFTERVDCESLDAVTITEEFDPQVAVRRGASQRTVAGTWSCEGEALDPGEPGCESGGCSYLFTPGATGDDLFAFDWSSLVHVVLTGGAHGSGQVVESVRATTAGGQLPDATSFSFAIADPPGFSLLGTSPAHGAQGVGRFNPIVVVFSEPPDCDALAAGTTITEHRQAGPVDVAGTWACTPAGAESAQDPEAAFACPVGGCAATFTPTVPFEPSAAVSVALAGGEWQAGTPTVGSSRATSRAGHLAASVAIEFGVADPVPLFVAGTTPADGAFGVAAGTALTVRFPRGLDCSSVVPCTGANATTCTLSVEEVADPLVGGTPLDGSNRARDFVTGTLSCLDGDTDFTFIPDSALSPSSDVVVTLAGAPEPAPAVRAVDESYLPAPVTLAYSVADPQPLQVVDTTPGTGATGVARDTDIKVRFSHALDCDTVHAVSVTAEVAADEAGPFTALAGIAGCSDDTVTFTPTTALAASSVVRLHVGRSDPTSTVRTALATTRGGYLAGPKTIQFQVADAAVFYVTNSTPANGTSGVAGTTALTVRFSDSLACASVVVCNGANDATCTVSVTATEDALAGSGSALVPGTVSCGEREFTFTPQNPFPASSRVVLRLKGSETAPAVTASTVEGGQLLSHFDVIFSVADPAPLAVVGTSPSGSATGIDRHAPVTVTFSADLDCATVNDTSVTVHAASPALPDGTPEGSFVKLAGTFACTGTDTFTFTPTVPPVGSSRVKVVVGTSDAATTVRAPAATSRGGFLPAPVEFEYRVADPAPLSLVATRPADDPTRLVFASTDVQFTFDRPVNCDTAGSRVSLQNVSNDTSVVGTVTCVGAEVRFTPSNPLTVGHSYVATVAEGLEASDATIVGGTLQGRLTQDVSFLFEVGAAPLSVTSHTPAAAAVGVLLGSELSLSFDQGVDPSSIVPCTSAGLPVGCNLSVNRGTSYNGTAIISVVPGTHSPLTLNYDLADGINAPNLAGGQTYFVRLRGGETGPLGVNGLSRLPTNLSFTFTTSIDSAVVSTTPAANATNVATTTDVCLEFSQNVTPASLTAGGTNQITVSWTDATGYTALVPLDAVPYTVAGRQVCLNIDQEPVPHVDGLRRLVHATTYTVTVSSQVEVGSVPLAAPYTFTFDTALPPALSGVSLANAVINEPLTDGLTDVPVNARFTIRFAETMNPANLTSANIVLEAASTEVVTSLQFDDADAPRTVTLTPVQPLDHKHQYTLRLLGGTVGLTTLAGEPMHNDVVFRFSTSPQTSVAMAPNNATLSERVMIAFLATRPLAPSSATPASVYGRHYLTQISGLVGMSESSPATVIFVPQPALQQGQTAMYAFGVTDALLDERGNPVAPFERNAISTGTDVPAPPLALSCEYGACAVAPAPGTMADGRPSWTLSFVDDTLAQRILPTTVFNSTTPGEGSISLVAMGGVGCPSPGTLVPLQVSFEPGTANGDKVSLTPTSQWLKAGCHYSLRVDQTRITNVYGLTATTVGCNGTTVADTVPTDVLSDSKCEPGNPSPGLIFTGESTAPSLVSLQAVSSTELFGPLDGATNIVAYSEIKAVISEPIDPATINGTTFSVSPGVTGSYRVIGNEILFVPTAPLQTGVTYTVKLEGMKDLAGNLLPTAVQTFSVENTPGSLNLVFPELSPRRGQPFGQILLSFSERIQVATLVPDTFSGTSLDEPGSLSLTDGAGPLPGRFVMDTVVPTLALFIPSRPVSGLVTATVNSTSAVVVTDLGGTPITPGTVPQL